MSNIDLLGFDLKMSLSSGLGLLSPLAPTLVPAATDKPTLRSVPAFSSSPAKTRRLCSLRTLRPLSQRLLPAALLLLAVQELPPRAIAGTAPSQLGSWKPALRRFSGTRSWPSPMEIPPSHYPATRAAELAANYINYQRGGPHRLFQARLVSQATLEDFPGAGRKYHLKFEMEEYVQKGSPLNCTAEVLYHLGDPQIVPEVHYSVDGEFETNSKEADAAFYNRIQNLLDPIEASNIPDNFGYMAEEMKPIYNLAKAASGYIVWQNSTENTRYNMVQIQSVKQMKRNDDYLEFSFVILIHNFVSSQDIIPWQMQVLWHPQHGIKVTENSSIAGLNDARGSGGGQS